MTSHFLEERGLQPFVSRLIAATKVIAPVAKKTKFVFAQLKTAEDLRLDYDCTILPPKKIFFPPKQPLLTFHRSEVKSCIEAEDLVLFGVHFYDIKAIDILDLLFREDNADQNYLAQREHTTIVGSSIQNVAPRAFWA